MRHWVVKGAWKVIDYLDAQRAKRAVHPQQVEVVEGVSYGSGHGPNQQLDLYYPAEEGRYPVIMYIHGGGFIAGDKAYTKHYCMMLAKKGYTVVNVNYRLAPEHVHPAPVYDVLAALTWVRENGGSFKGDAAKVVLAGNSAGAYLAAYLACLCSHDSLAKDLGVAVPFWQGEIKGVMLFSGLFDLVGAAERRFVGIRSDLEMYLGTKAIDSYPYRDKYSVLKNITGQFPPAFISCGEVDGLYPESVALVQVLSQRQIKHRALLFPKTERRAFHDYQQHLKLPTAQTCFQSAISFLQDTVPQP